MTSGFFLKLKSPLKGKRFQTVSGIQENTMGQLIAIGRTVRGPNVHTLFLVPCIFFNKCLYFSYYMAGYLLDRPHISVLLTISKISATYENKIYFLRSGLQLSCICAPLCSTSSHFRTQAEGAATTWDMQSSWQKAGKAKLCNLIKSFCSDRA